MELLGEPLALVSCEVPGLRRLGGAHYGFEKGELDEEAAERRLLCDGVCVELTEPERWVGFLIGTCPQQAPAEASLVLVTKDLQFARVVGTKLVFGDDVMVESECGRSLQR